MDKYKVYEIGQAYIKLDLKANDEFKESFEKFLLYKGKQYSKEFYHKEFLVDGFYFTVELEDGSLKSRLKIFGKIALAAVVGYGGIRSGIDYIVNDAQTVTEHIASDVANEPNIGNNRIIRVERRLGVPGKIKRLYNDIDRIRANRDNLTENEQREILDKIQRNIDDLVFDLDETELQIIQQDLNQNQIPLPFREPNQILNLPRQYAIREKEIRLIREDEIQRPRQLPLLQ